MTPTILHFIICDRVGTDPQNLHSINVEGLKWSIRSKQVPRFPCSAPLLTILAIFMGGQGKASFSFRVVQDNPRRVISTSQWPHSIRFLGDPHEVYGMKAFLKNCSFPRAGLYWVELVFSGSVIARQPIRIS